jgi:hypothetical protein
MAIVNSNACPYGNDKPQTVWMNVIMNDNTTQRLLFQLCGALNPNKAAEDYQLKLTLGLGVGLPIAFMVLVCVVLTRLGCRRLEMQSKIAAQPKPFSPGDLQV